MRARNEGRRLPKKFLVGFFGFFFLFLLGFLCIFTPFFLGLLFAVFYLRNGRKFGLPAGETCRGRGRGRGFCSLIFAIKLLLVFL